ncbi:hypothetical protein VP01_115g6 [Puccinia sorghi]|uniref:Uncharacterized protein n=1 Tax=Puccinia sorghi TaxID=27349 RepID=A0A0L6VRJ7_9BASI|nr:hypothetical protein VP01_115g6 [Puccinia sorghi]
MKFLPNLNKETTHSSPSTPPQTLSALQHTFVLEKSFLNDENKSFRDLDLLKNKAIAALMRKLSLSKELFIALGSKCQRSGRRHKIMLVEKMIQFSSDNLPTSKSWLARFCSIMSDLLLRLPLVLTQRTLNTPLRSERSRMDPPLLCHQVQSHPILKCCLMRSTAVAMTVTNLHIAKATFYCGKVHSDSLMEHFGYTCLYCKETGSRFIPPTRQQHTPLQSASQSGRQSNGHICKIDVPEANDGTILIDSGSTINMSGKSRFYKITSKLDCPLTISLAI